MQKSIMFHPSRKYATGRIAQSFTTSSGVNNPTKMESSVSRAGFQLLLLWNLRSLDVTYAWPMKSVVCAEKM